MRIASCTLEGRSGHDAGRLAEEQAERTALREEYIAAFRGNLEAHLKSITIQYPDGSKKKLSKKEPTLH